MRKIETSRLTLREPMKEDAVVLGALWLDKKVRSYLGGVIPKEQIPEKIELLLSHWRHHHFGLWVVCDKDTLQIMGLCGPHRSDDGIEISYMFFPVFWGKGFATESLIASIDYCFSLLDIESIIAITQKANTNSCALLQRLRFKHIKDFIRYDDLQSIYSINKKAW